MLWKFLKNKGRQALQHLPHPGSDPGQLFRELAESTGGRPYTDDRGWVVEYDDPQDMPNRMHLAKFLPFWSVEEGENALFFRRRRDVRQENRQERRQERQERRQERQEMRAHPKAAEASAWLAARHPGASVANNQDGSVYMAWPDKRPSLLSMLFLIGSGVRVQPTYQGWVLVPHDAP